MNPEFDEPMDDDARERAENDAEDWETQNDPFSTDEKEQMGSEEFFHNDA